jgi:hypothetical protein
MERYSTPLPPKPDSPEAGVSFNMSLLRLVCPETAALPQIAELREMVRGNPVLQN